MNLNPVLWLIYWFGWCYLIFILSYLVLHRCTLWEAIDEGTHHITENLPKFLSLYAIYTVALLFLILLLNIGDQPPTLPVRLLGSITIGYLGVLICATANIFYLNQGSDERKPIQEDELD